MNGHDKDATSSQSILFQSDDRSVILVDVPRSIEEAQVLWSEGDPEMRSTRRLVSSKPLDAPFKTPEPKDGTGGLADSVSDLMSAAAATNALKILREAYRGQWCLPRVTDSVGQGDEKSLKRKRDGSSREATPDNGGSPTAGRKDLAEEVPFIPEKSFNLQGTISSERDRFLREAPQFDLIVLDPPWPNRSARRKKRNYTVAHSLGDIRRTLSLIPIAAHLAPDGLVAVWVTNNVSVTELLTGANGLLAEWGLEEVDEWTWLKVTTTGEPIVDLNSAWRKPWERILIARRRGSQIKLPCRGRVIVSVPDLHSRKANLRGLFDDVLPHGYQGLEVFARNLTAGWWSWGDEVLKFQQPEHWVES